MSFLTVCLNPTLQKTLSFPSIISGSVNRTAVHRLDASGKGINVTRVLTQLGKKAVHLTQLGGSFRPQFLSLCEQDGLFVKWAECNSDIRFCYTVLNESDSSVTELIEESQPVCADTEQKLIKLFTNILNKADTPHSSLRPLRLRASARNSFSINCLIVSGTKAAGFSDEILPAMVCKAKEKGLRVILDIKGKDLIESLKYEPDVIKPNLLEFVSTFAPELIRNNEVTLNDTTKEQIKSIMIDTARKYGSRIILTNGSRKILAAEKDSYSEIDVPVVKAVNTTGCGDAFTAGLASALEDCWFAKQTWVALQTLDLNTAINEGIRCGALNAELVRPGVIR